MSRESRKPFIEESLELDVPADVAYGESRELEHFPLFLPEVMRVERLEDQRFRWVADYAGTSVVREVEIEGIVPGRQISWRAHGVPEYFGTRSSSSQAPNGPASVSRCIARAWRPCRNARQSFKPGSSDWGRA